MKTFILTLVLLPFIFYGCDSVNESESRKYVEGDVSFTPNDDVSFEKLIDTVFTFGTIYQIKFTANKSSSLPKDSLNYINSSLSHYNFIDTSVTNVTYDSIQTKWEIHLWIRGFCEENIPDWYNLQNQLNLQPVPTYFGYGLLKVEPGKEKYWINKLLDSGLCDWADYNYIADITY